MKALTVSIESKYPIFEIGKLIYQN